MTTQSIVNAAPLHLLYGNEDVSKAVLKRDVQMRIGYSALRSESSSIIFFILLEEFAFSDSIISDFAQNSCSRYSDTF
jgi:hypothetical protein